MTDEWRRTARVLIVDDDPDVLQYLVRVLEDDGYSSILALSDPSEALGHFAAFAPDLVMLDLHMPRMNGFDVMRELRPWIPAEAFLPIVMLTGDGDPTVKEEALAGGAMDFLGKPAGPVEIRLRIRNLLATRYLHLQLQRSNEQLEARVVERTQELEWARLEALERLARAAEFRDDETGEHTRRVGHIAGELTRVMGCPPEEVELITRAATLHDLGKIGVPDNVLLKPGRLTPKEFARMKQHTAIGARILSGTESPVLRLAGAIALSHHERWDGRGYPEGKKGSEIPLAGRIVAVADVFDALTHRRPYKPAWTLDQALSELAAQRGTQLDPGAVEALFHIIDRITLVP